MILRRSGGVQVDIVASLCVVMLAAVGVVVAAVASYALRSTEEAAIERLRMGTAHLVRSVSGRAAPLADLAALARAAGETVRGGELRVLDDAGRELGKGPPLPPLPAEEPWLERARRRGEAVYAGPGWLDDVHLVTRVRFPNAVGFVAARVPAERLRAELAPLARSAAWVLFMSAGVFVGLGSYLLRRGIVRPLHDLNHAAERIAAGDLEARTPVSGPLEVARLGEAFNGMVASLAAERAALLEAQQSLTRSERLAAVGRLAAGVAHEVGNPATAILGYTEALRRSDGLSDSAQGAVDEIRAETLRIQKLIRDMLDLARPEPLALARVAVREMLERAAARAASEPTPNGVTVEVGDADATLAVHSDADRCDQILLNLVRNAIQALGHAGGGRVRLRARQQALARRPARRRDDRLRGAPDRPGVAIEVIDDGPGIDPAHLDQVFDPFFTTKQPGEGTGLGLWNSHRLAELLGGRLEVDSEPGRTCFRLTLPAADTHGDDDAAAHSHHR